MTVRLQGLPPVIGRATRLLILGSFPSAKSLEAQQYYAHPRNHFWPILSDILDEPLVTLPYRQRLRRVIVRGLGIWDSIVACERPGSLDSSIRQAAIGEIARVTGTARQLTAVAFNGTTAAQAESLWNDAGYRTLRLPSSSPAYTLPLMEKIRAWHVLREFLAPAA